MAKYINKEDIKNIIDLERASGKKIVLASGAFDVLTVFDIRYLRSAKQAGDILFVVLYFDEYIKLRFGDKFPIMAFEDRLEILKNMEMIDYIIKGNRQDLEILELLNPDIIIGEQRDGIDIVRAVLEKCGKDKK